MTCTIPSLVRLGRRSLTLQRLMTGRQKLKSMRQWFHGLNVGEECVAQTFTCNMAVTHATTP